MNIEFSGGKKPKRGVLSQFQSFRPNSANFVFGPDI